MKLCLWIIAALLHCSLLSQAAEPKAVINGPGQSPAPGIVVLDPAGSVDDDNDFAWFVDGGAQIFEDRNGRAVVFYMGSTPITATVTLYTAGVVDEKIHKAFAKYPVSFGGQPNPPGPTPPNPNPLPPVPVPPNPPVPPAPPVPVLPDGRYKLAALAYTEAMKIAPAARADATKVAAAINAVVAANINSTDTSYEAIKAVGAQVNAAIATAVGGDVDAWGPWCTAVKAAVNNLYGHDKGINTVADFCVANQELAQGVGQAK